MKISCQSCQAKYTIADEKVLGKIVKIRCKKCSATIVINGNEQAAPAAGGDNNAYDYTAQPGAEPWTVNVTDGDQRTMSVQEIVQEYRAGVINDETYCWKDGMSDWLPLREIEELYAMAGGAGGDDAPMSAGPAEVIAGGGLFGQGQLEVGSDQPASMRPEANGNGNGGAGGLFGSAPPPAAAAATTSAARRVGGRGGGDLFGAVATAGGEEDVMTSAPVAPPPVSDEPQKLTGQRNENSVLFSLAALTTNEKKAESSTPTNDGSGLIDIRALSQSMTNDKKKDDKGAHVDDIMNLGGGGAFGAALAAPILAPPPMDSALLEAAAASPTGGRQRNTVVLAGVGVVFVAMLFTIIFLATRKPDEPVAQPTALPSAAAVPTDTGPAPTQAPLAMNDTPKAPDKDKPAAAAPPKVGGGGGGKTSGGGGGGHASAGGGGGGGGANPTPTPAAGGGGGGPKSLGDAIRDSAGVPAGAPAAAPAAAAAPFNRGAAAAALGSVNVASCKKPDGPTGSGHVSVTFQPDGSVQSAVVDQPPFAGTPVGGCVGGKFRGARVPAFSGGNVKVGKSFVVN